MQENGIWSVDEAKDNHQFSKKLANELCKIINPVNTVIDMGCGPGQYVDFLNNSDIDTIGLEGTEFNHDKIFKADLTTPLEGYDKSDVVISLEVAEHIPVEFEDQYLKNITEYAKSKVILSWAVPGQGGLGHVNEQTNDYVIKKMDSLGFRINREQTNKLRLSVKDCHCWWFKDTLMVFEK